MNDAEVLSLYEAILPISRKMLAAAKNKEWDNLVALEKDYTLKTEKAVASDAGNSHNAAFNRKKAELIGEILNNAEEIQSLARLAMGEIRAALDSTQVAIMLNQAYNI